MSIENLILSNLLYNEEYSRKVIPFLKTDYFSDQSQLVIYKLIDIYFNKYNACPSLDALAIDLTNIQINEMLFNQSKEVLASLQNTPIDIKWLLENTEQFCQEKAIYNAIRKSLEVMDDKTGKLSRGSIPQLLTDALGVSFDTHIGHDFIEDSSERFEFYHKKEVRVPFDLEYMNKITNGGLPRKTLNVILAGTGVGKSLFMCHCAAANLDMGYNVLYITLEMAEERIAERIDANLLNVTLDELKTIPKEYYDKKFEKIKSRTKGKLIIKEYPTACAGSANFRHLLNELKIKKNFHPDIIYIDYINICTSSRLKNSAAGDSYTLVKSIAEELRGLAVEFNLPIVSATQVNRSGFSNSDFDLENTSESFGLPMTVDFMIGLIKTDELESLNQILVKQLKTRYNDPNFNKRFVLGLDRSKMRLYNVEQNAQEDILDGPVMDNTSFGQEDNERSKPKPKFNRTFR